MFYNLFDGLTPTEIRTLYRKLAHQHHPDKGGDTKTMQELNRVYKEVLEKASSNDPDFDMKHEERLMEKIQKVINLDDVKIEILGSWLWVTGETYQHKQYLKENGFFFSKQKTAWYYHNEEEKGKWKFGAKPLEEIRQKYGSHEVKNKKKKLSLA